MKAKRISRRDSKDAWTIRRGVRHRLNVRTIIRSTYAGTACMLSFLKKGERRLSTGEPLGGKDHESLAAGFPFFKTSGGAIS
jgi:hypothetical protein